MATKVDDMNGPYISISQSLSYFVLQVPSTRHQLISDGNSDGIFRSLCMVQDLDVCPISEVWHTLSLWTTVYIGYSWWQNEHTLTVVGDIAIGWFWFLLFLFYLFYKPQTSVDAMVTSHSN